MENLYHIGYSEKGVLLQRTIRGPRWGGEGIFMAKHTVNTTHLVGDQENNTFLFRKNGKVWFRMYRGEEDGQ